MAPLVGDDFAHGPSGRQKPQAKKRAMAVNSNKPEQWKQDVAASVDMYNNWLMRSAPAAFRQTPDQTTQEVENMACYDPKSDQCGR